VCAKASFTRPSAIAGSHCARCAGVAPRAMKAAPNPTVDRYGSTTNASPIASIVLIMSTAPPPKPPCSDGTGNPSSPMSANAFQAAALQPSGEATMRRRASNE
jgi:hypothetical protein